MLLNKNLMYAASTVFLWFVTQSAVARAATVSVSDALAGKIDAIHDKHAYIRIGRFSKDVKIEESSGAALITVKGENVSLESDADKIVWPGTAKGLIRIPKNSACLQVIKKMQALSAANPKGFHVFRISQNDRKQWSFNASGFSLTNMSPVQNECTGWDPQLNIGYNSADRGAPTTPVPPPPANPLCKNSKPQPIAYIGCDPPIGASTFSDYTDSFTAQAEVQVTYTCVNGQLSNTRFTGTFSMLVADGVEQRMGMPSFKPIDVPGPNPNTSIEDYIFTDTSVDNGNSVGVNLLMSTVGDSTLTFSNDPSTVYRSQCVTYQ